MTLRITSVDPRLEHRVLAMFMEETADGEETAESKALNWLDDLLVTVKGFSLLSELNAIQAECNLDRNPPPFPSKYSMPLCIVNLVLKEHGLELKEG